MARIRTIKPDFCTSPSTAKLSRDARLLFLQLLTEADDEGRLLYSAKRLAGALYPYDDGVTGRTIDKWVAECVAQDMFIRYSVEGTEYLAITNFSKHQRVSHPTDSRFPPPPLPNHSRSSPEPLRSDSEVLPKNSSGKGREGKGRESSSSSVSGAPGAGSDSGEEEESALRRTCQAVAERRLKRRNANPTLEPIASPAAWLAKTADGVAGEHAVWIRELLALGKDPDQAAELIDPDPVKAPPNGLPESPELARARLNDARRERPCQHCDGDGGCDTAAGWTRCEACQGVGVGA